MTVLELMAKEPVGKGVLTDHAGATGESLRAGLDLANSNRAMASGLGGTSVAILTFALFFLYSGALNGQFDPSLFRLTMGAIVACLFLFSYAAIYYYRLMDALERRESRATALLRRADVTFLLGLVLLTVTPVLVLLTARLWDVGLFSLVLWLGVLLLLVRGWLERR